MELEQQEGQYHLSQVFKIHNRSARTVDSRGKYAISGSEDSTVKIYEVNEQTGQFSVKNELNIFEKMIYVVKVRQDGKGFFVGGQDRQIYVLDEDGSPILVLQGHEGTVNSLSQVNETQIVSGSWDGTAKLWNFQTGECIKTFEGHSHATSVLALESLDLLITGSQDKSLKFFKLSTGELQKEVKAAHLDIIRELRFVEDVGFLSCSNDETVKLWAYDGDQLGQFLGHKGFVFAVNSINFGEYVSGGDDKQVKIWKQEKEFQTIDHPSTIWNVAVAENKDIITACGDGVVRVFSVQKERQASPEIQANFQEEVKVSNQASASQQMSTADIQKLPTDPSSVKGQKDGEYKLFREGNDAIAYLWVGAEQKWEKIGQVTGTGGAQGGGAMGKRHYQGDLYFEAGEYDYIFDVEDDSGQPKLLPFNDSDCTFTAAKKYIAREGLSLSFIGQIEQFLVQNSSAGRKQQDQQIQEQYEQNQQQFESKQLKKSEFFPTLSFFKQLQFNKDACQKKILEFNAKIKEDESLKQLVILEIENKRLNSIIDFVGTDGNQAKSLDTAQWEMLNERLLKWPKEYRTPVYDMLRVFVVHPQAEKLFTGLDAGMDFLLDVCTYLQDPSTSDGVVALLIKILYNAFQISNGKMGMQRHYRILTDAFKEVLKRQNNNVKSQLSNLLLNYTVDIHQRVEGGQAKQINDYIVGITEFSVLALQSSLNPDAELKLLVSLGNLVDCAGKLVKPIMRDVVLKHTHQGGDQKVEQCLKDLKNHINH